MKNGTRPTRIDNRDYDFVKSHALGGVTQVNFPDSYNTDADIWMPNQDLSNPQFMPPAGPMPYGCTDFSQADIGNDLQGALVCNPEALEAITHANANGGGDMRTSLSAAKQLDWITGFFNVIPAQLDYFDTIRLAMVSGIPEKRSVTIGTPWFSVFEQPDSNGVLSTPPNFDTTNVPWHNHKICGWKSVQGVVVLISKSWQGPNYADHGLCYWPRALVNSVMSVPGTAAFTATRGVMPPVSTISVTLLQWLISNLKNILSIQY